jgi:ABC-type transport system, involved in lipoprotein release, permease component
VYLPLFIAKRYLFAKKSHNVINIISIISACGIAVGTAALIIILSIFNGMQGLIAGIYGVYEPDLLITPTEGKSFSPTESFDAIKRDHRVAYYCEIVEENLFIRYGNEESIATIRGVDSSFAAVTRLKDRIIEGRFSLYHGEVPEAVMGRNLAYNLGARTSFIEPIELYFPSRYRQISIVNPSSSLNREKLFLSGIFGVEQEYDSRYIFAPISIARNLLEYEDEVTSIELYMAPGTDMKRAKEEFKELLGADYSVKDRYEQNESLYKMVRSEKLMISIILFFVVVIIACNLFGSLSMLIMEKREDIQTLRSLGATGRIIKRIFILEGWIVSLIGVAVGAFFGLLICFVQRIFGIIPMPGNFITKSYPVVINIWDVLLTVCSIAALGLAIALINMAIEKREKIFDV